MISRMIPWSDSISLRVTAVHPTETWLSLGHWWEIVHVAIIDAMRCPSHDTSLWHASGNKHSDETYLLGYWGPPLEQRWYPQCPGGGNIPGYGGCDAETVVSNCEVMRETVFSRWEGRRDHMTARLTWPLATVQLADPPEASWASSGSGDTVHPMQS